MLDTFRIKIAFEGWNRLGGQTLNCEYKQ